MPSSNQELKYFIEQFSSSTSLSELFFDELKAALKANDEHAIHEAVLAIQAKESLSPILSSEFQRYLESYDYEQNQAKAVSFDLFPWDSPEVKEAEWDYAKQELMPGGVLLPDGTKLRRKDPENAEFIKHSFIIVDGKILAMAPQGDYLGRGGSAIVKLAEDDHGGVWALKIRRDPRNHYTGRGTFPDSPEMEEAVAVDLGKSLKSVFRIAKGSSFFSNDSKEGEKHYLPFVYLGTPLNKYLTEHDLSETQRYELGIKLVLAVHAFQSGEHSKTNIKYLHRDLSERNVVIDDTGEVHLIDYGCSSVNDNTDSMHDYYANRDIRSLLVLLRGRESTILSTWSGGIFTQEMCDGNKELSDFLALYGSRRDFPEDPSLEIAEGLMRIQSNASSEAQSKSPKL